MLVGCPQCKTRYKINDEKTKSAGVVLRCRKCRTLFRTAGKSSRQDEKLPEKTGSGDMIKVLVANESPAFCQTVEKVLAAEPEFSVSSCHDGKTALAMIGSMLPDVVLLDVALPLMFGFEVCEQVKSKPATASVKIILIAAIYDKTKYKRAPVSLYGADDYIEKHHIPDSLIAKIYRLTSGVDSGKTAAAGQSPVEEAGRADVRQISAKDQADQENARREIRRDEELATLSADVPQNSEAHRKAQRLARIIASDIALYNEGRVEEGVLNGTFYSLLADDLSEGRKLYERRVPAEVRECSSYLEDAFSELIAKKKEEMEPESEPGAVRG